MKQLITILLILITLTSFGQGTKFTIKGSGSNVGDSVKKNTDTLGIYKTLVYPNIVNTTTNTTNISLKRNISDTAGNAGVTTIFQVNKSKDSLQVNIQNTTDSISTKLAVRDSIYSGYLPFSKYKPINISYGDSIIFFGDSYTQSQQATSSAYGYVANVITATGTSANNLSVSARGGKVATVSAYTSANVLNVGNTNPTIWMAGLNDFRRMGSSTTMNAKTGEKVKSCLRAIIANNYLSTAVAANNAAVTAAGTWTTTSGIGDKASLGLSGLVRVSGATSSTLSYTFTGDNIVVGTFSTDQVTTTGGDWTYSIDAGVFTGSYTGKNKADGVSDGVTDNSICPNALVVTGLGSGSHTIVITASETASARIDYFGTLQTVSAVNPFIVCSIPKMVDSGYRTLNGSNALWNQADSILKTVISEYYKYPVYFVDINQFYNTATGVGVDSIHPNNTGYAQISKGILNRISNNSFFKNYNGYLGIGTDAPIYPITVTFNQGSALRNRITNTNTGTGGSAATEAANTTSAVQMGITSTGYTTSGNFIANTAFLQGNGVSKMLIQNTASSPISFATNSVERLSILGSGLVGIGGTVPTLQLSIIDSGANSTRGLLLSQSNTSATSSYLLFQKSRGTPNAPTAVTNADVLGIMDWKGYVGSTNGYIIGSRISSNVVGTVTDVASGISTNMIFITRNRAGSPERWRIDTTGNFTNSLNETSSAVLQTTSFATGYRAISALRTLDATDNLIECTSGTFTVTLPTAVGITGREYWITNTGSGSITIGTTSSQTFANVTATPTTLTVAQFSNYRVVSNGANWLAYKIVN